MGSISTNMVAPHAAVISTYWSCSTDTGVILIPMDAPSAAIPSHNRIVPRMGIILMRGVVRCAVTPAWWTQEGAAIAPTSDAITVIVTTRRIAKHVVPRIRITATHTMITPGIITTRLGVPNAVSGSVYCSSYYNDTSGCRKCCGSGQQCTNGLFQGPKWLQCVLRFEQEWHRVQLFEYPVWIRISHKHKYGLQGLLPIRVPGELPVWDLLRLSSVVPNVVRSSGLVRTVILLIREVVRNVAPKFIQVHISPPMQTLILATSSETVTVPKSQCLQGRVTNQTCDGRAICCDYSDPMICKLYGFHYDFNGCKKCCST